MRYFLQIAYNGSNYAGWQVQPNANTVQAEVQKAIATLTKGIVTEVVGCGRTDTGVHASSYYLHFDAVKLDWNPADFVYKLNAILPNDIVAYKLIPVAPNAHSRFDATCREYKYIISKYRNPFHDGLVSYCWKDLDITSMATASSLLIGSKDFTSFCKLHSDNKTNICEVFAANWNETDSTLIFTISANRFLRNMVRAIVGTLLQVGEGKIPAESITNILNEHNRSKAGQSAPASGLYLHNILYPYIKDEHSRNGLSFWKGI